MANKNFQFLFSTNDLLLKIQVVDSGGKKYFKETCSVLNKKRIKKILKLISLKYNVNIPENLNEDIYGWENLD